MKPSTKELTPSRNLVLLLCFALLLGTSNIATAEGSHQESSPIRINFQPKNRPAVCGYTQDNGDVYSARHELSFGWNVDHTDAMHEGGALSDRLLDTLAHFHAGGVWEIAVPNGTHDVKVSIGDTSHRSVNTINVEGVNYWDSVRLNTHQFQQSTKTVMVTDGKLTIDQGSLGDGMTHINHLEIDATGTIPSCSTPISAASMIPTPSPVTLNTPTPTPTPVLPEMKVDFQPTGSPRVCGYLLDDGATFASREGISYGWNIDHADVTRDRDISVDQLLDTLVHFKAGGIWEIAVENGTHEVTAVIGDPAFPSRHTLNVEGVGFWNDTYLGAAESAQATRRVTVNDGRLTLDAGTAPDMSTRLAYLSLNPDNVGDVCDAPTSTPSPTPTPTPTTKPFDPTPIVRVNYQSNGSNRVCGYRADHGESYGPRNKGEYGWNFSHENTTRDREVRYEQRLDTLAHFHTGGVWELRLPRGLHEVTVSVGDPSYSSDYTLNVEGVNLWKNAHLEANEFRQLTRQVDVTDGRLTLHQGAAYEKATRINYITVNAESPPTGCAGLTEAAPEPKAQPVEDGNGGTAGDGEGKGRLGARPYGLSGLIRVFGPRCNDKSNDARTWYPSAGGRGKWGYVYYHSKLARKIGGRVLGALLQRNRTGAVDYGVWGYSCRIKRGGTGWSVHSWGVAIDTNTLLNPWQTSHWNGRGANGRHYGRMLPKLWLRQNFYWGINFRDPMHFQYVSGY